MLHFQRLREQLDLNIHSRTGHLIVNFLQKNNIGGVLSKRFNDPLRTISTVHTSNPFVDIVTDDSN